MSRDKRQPDERWPEYTQAMQQILGLCQEVVDQADEAQGITEDAAAAAGIARRGRLLQVETRIANMITRGMTPNLQLWALQSQEVAKKAISDLSDLNESGG